MNDSVRPRWKTIGALAVASVVAVSTMSLGAAGALAQGGASGSADREELSILCQVNAESEEDLALCLDVVERILVPDDGTTAPETSEADDAFDPIQLKGKGDKLARFEKPEDEVAIADIAHSGKGAFSVWSIASDGDKNDLLVNEAGKYEGTVLFDQRDISAAFEIGADGKWSATIKPVTSARIWSTSAALEGTGDDVILLDSAIEGLASTRIAHQGKGAFAVWSYTEDGDADLLVNEAGKYDGEVLLPAGTRLLEVTGAGKWSMSSPE